MAEQGFVSRPQSRCLSREEMVAYHTGKLSPSERYNLEVHLSDCPFCSDALEGLESANPLSFVHADDELKLRLEELTKPDEGARVRVLFPWRIAAAFALLLASLATLWLAIPDRSESGMIGEAFEPYPAPSATPANPEPGQIEESVQNEAETVSPPPTVIQKSGKVDSEVNEDLSAQESQPVAAEANEINYDSESGSTTTGATALSDSRKPAEESFTTREKDVVAEDLQEVVVVSSKKSLSKSKTESIEQKRNRNAQPAAAEMESKALKVDTRFEEAMAFYNKGEYQQALSLLKQIPEAPSSGFYAGICCFSLGKYDDAEGYLRSVIKSGEVSLQEAANWYLGLTLAKKGDNRSARRYLQQVVRFNGEFKQKAEKLLEEL